MAKIWTVPETIDEARGTLRALKAVRSRAEPLLTSTEAKYKTLGQQKIQVIDEKVAKILEAYPALKEAKAAKKPARDELTGKVEIDRTLVLERLKAVDGDIMAQIARILTSHASRKALEASMEAIVTAEAEAAPEGEPQTGESEQPQAEAPEPREGEPDAPEAPEEPKDEPQADPLPMAAEGEPEVAPEAEKPAEAAPQRGRGRGLRRAA